MTSRFCVVLRCDNFADDPESGGRKLCSSYIVGAPSKNIQEVRDMAHAKGWTFRPGAQYRHIDARDYCPDCSKGSPT